VPLLLRSRTLKDSRMLWRRAGGIWERESLDVVRKGATGREGETSLVEGGVGLSKREASFAVPIVLGRTV